MRLPRRKRKYFALLTLGLFLPLAANGQQGKTGSSNSNDSSPSKKEPAPPRGSPPAPRPEIRPMGVPLPPPIFISGMVLKEDGEPPPFGTIVKLDCGHTSTNEASVALNGTYTFQVGGNNWSRYVHPDAAERIAQDQYSGMLAEGSIQSYLLAASTTRRLYGCELTAQMNGYRSTAVRLDRELTTGQNDFGTIFIYPAERIKGSSVSLTTLAAPKKAKKQMSKARKSLDKKKYDEAEKSLRSALELYPEYAEAWFTLGQVQQQKSLIEEARWSYWKAKELDTNYVNPYVGLAQLAASEENWQETADLSDRSLQLDPIGFIYAYFLNGLAHYRLKAFDLAGKRARQGQRIDTLQRYPQLYLLMANILAAQGDMPGSVQELKDYLRFAPDGPNADLIRSQLRKLEELSAR